MTCGRGLPHGLPCEQSDGRKGTDSRSPGACVQKPKACVQMLPKWGIVHKLLGKAAGYSKFLQSFTENKVFGVEIKVC